MGFSLALLSKSVAPFVVILNGTRNRAWIDVADPGIDMFELRSQPLDFDILTQRIVRRVYKPPSMLCDADGEVDHLQDARNGAYSGKRCKWVTHIRTSFVVMIVSPYI